jgi:hypothetical protein
MTRTRRRSARRASSGSSIGSATSGLLGGALSGAAIAFIEKNLPVPVLPMLGRKGTIGLLAYFWAKSGGGQMASRVALAAATLAGYEYIATGAVSGDDDL